MKSVLRRLASELLPPPTVKTLGLSVAIGVLAGCVIPQDEEYLSELPARLNHPLRIVESQVQPSERIIRGYGSDLCELEFSVIVEDPDIADTINAYWFVDYDPNHPRGADSEASITPTGNKKPVRDERASFHVRFNSADLSRLNIPGDHVVEVVVTDTALVAREPQPKSSIPLSDGTTYVDPGYTATYAWFVRTEAGGACP